MKFSERIEQALEASSKKVLKEKLPSIYEKFGYLDNPFPTKSYPIWKRFYNQKEVKEAFEKELINYIEGDQKNTTFFLLGGNRIGKTHFLKHHCLELENTFRKKGNPDFPPIFTKASSGNFLQNYRDIILQLNRHYEDTTKEEFFLQFLNYIKDKPDFINNMPKNDLRRALKHSQSSVPKQKAFIETEDFVGRYPIFLKWLENATLEKREKQSIGVFSPLKTSSSSIYVLKQIIKIGRTIGLVKGIIVFLDEFEVIWPTVRADRRLRYFQDLREFIDELPNGLFLIVAMTEDTEHKLKEEYPALYGRISSPTRQYNLNLIQGTKDACEYANYFLEEARREFEEERKTEFQDGHIISKVDVMQTLEKVFPERKASQGDFFDALHSLVEDKIKGTPKEESN